jgi:hypothetical protein
VSASDYAVVIQEDSDSVCSQICRNRFSGGGYDLDQEATFRRSFDGVVAAETDQGRREVAALRKPNLESFLGLHASKPASIAHTRPRLLLEATSLTAA